MIHWHQLNNLYAGCTAVLIGRGPTLDDWLAAGEPLPSSNFVTIGINAICLLSDVDFSVSADNDANKWVGPRTRWVRGVPYVNAQGETVYDLPIGSDDLWFNHGEQNTEGRETRLQQSRYQISLYRRLYCASSSAHPAIHFAWYLGCTDLITIGIDGFGRRALATEPAPGKPPPPEEVYGKMLIESHKLLNHLFPDAWEKWKRPKPTNP